MGEWQLVWRTTVPFPILHVAFSCDGTLFATCGQNDRFVKVWYENKHGMIFFKYFNFDKNTRNYQVENTLCS